ncbi:MAG: hypothetical protein VX727_00870 [Planctomycetota bacterium]|nr:hypothetical protein [Planctomycetota bacterium]
MTRRKPEPMDPDEPPIKDEKAKRSFTERLSAQREKARAGFERLKEHLGQEREETREMFEIYNRAMEGDATREEIKRANEQFGDLLRLAGMGTFFTLIPGSTLLLPVAVAGAKKVGIRLLPSSFSEEPDPDGPPSEPS